MSLITSVKRSVASRPRCKFLLCLLLPTLIFLSATTSRCLEPKEVLVVYNSNLPDSAQLAAYYQQMRQVPQRNLFGIPLPDKEVISRADFEKLLVTPLRNRLARQGKKNWISTLLLFYGIPLKVGPAQPPGPEWVDTLKLQRQTIGDQMTSLLNRLDTLLELPPGSFSGPLTMTEVENRWKRVEGQLTVWQKNHDTEQDFKSRNSEVQTLLIRLNGLAPLAQSARQKIQEGFRPKAMGSLVSLSALVEQQFNLFLFSGVTQDTLLNALSLLQINKGIFGAYSFLTVQQQQSPAEQSSAAVDSELCLLRLPSYRTGRWLANPFQPKYDHFPGIDHLRRQTLMVCRLDGPSPATVRRMINDALYAEQHGLTGNFYIDGRGLADKEEKKDSYSEYDGHLEKLYQDLKGKCPLPVVYDNTPALFPAHAELPAALYVGWYSLGKYVDAFAWQRGAVGFHVASAEASTLREEGSTVWCKRMLEKGITATLGPTEEPYLQSFPLPDQFFPLLLEGKLPLIEVYYRTLPYLSWRQVLIGDPLYRPFANHPAPHQKRGIEEGSFQNRPGQVKTG